MEEHASRRDVAQRREFERAAQIAALGEIRAIGAAESEVEVVGVRRRRNADVARNAEVVVAEVGEERKLAIRATAAWMTRRAIPFVRAVEQCKSAKLRGLEADATAQKFVVLRIERTKIGIDLFVLREREQ